MVLVCANGHFFNGSTAHMAVLASRVVAPINCVVFGLPPLYLHCRRLIPWSRLHTPSWKRCKVRGEGSPHWLNTFCQWGHTDESAVFKGRCNSHVNRWRKAQWCRPVAVATVTPALCRIGVGNWGSKWPGRRCESGVGWQFLLLYSTSVISGSLKHGFTVLSLRKSWEKRLRA